MLPEIDDTAVVDRVRAGEGALFEILMRRHNPKVYRSVRAILRDEAEIEDVMQQAYLRAYTHLHQFTGAAKVSTWLVKIAINEALQRLRKKRPESIEGDVIDMGPTGTDPEHRASNAELRGFLEASVDKLPENYRTVFMLREVEGLDTRDTAEALDLSEDTVKIRLHRAKAALQKDLATAMQSAASDAYPFHAVRCDRVVRTVLALISRSSSAISRR